MYIFLERKKEKNPTHSLLVFSGIDSATHCGSQKHSLKSKEEKQMKKKKWEEIITIKMGTHQSIYFILNYVFNLEQSSVRSDFIIFFCAAISQSAGLRAHARAYSTIKRDANANITENEFIIIFKKFIAGRFIVCAICFYFNLLCHRRMKCILYMPWSSLFIDTKKKEKKFWSFADVRWPLFVWIFQLIVSAANRLAKETESIIRWLAREC